MKTISVEEFRAELAAQGVSGREHGAFKCPACGTVQSMALLAKEGVPENRLEGQIGFSCVGRWNDAGAMPATMPWGGPRTDGKTGCNWTLGGLFREHKLVVIDERGEHPCFELATPAEAKALQFLMTGVIP